MDRAEFKRVREWSSPPKNRKANLKQTPCQLLAQNLNDSNMLFLSQYLISSQHLRY